MVQPARWFQLTEHFTAKDRTDNNSKYLIVSAIHTATNNYLQERGEPAEYCNTFVVSRRYVPWRPGRGFNSIRVQVPAPQTATVVGPEGAGSLNVDEYGRIQATFHWDREARHSARIRVCGGWAGGVTGAVSHPRVGSEVVIQCLDGNPDHPIVTGVVYNARRMPPWTLPEQKALTGLRSRELQGDNGNAPGGRSNHVLLDDTEGKIQAQIRSDHDASQLSLGHITRIERTVGRQDARGQGFELRTDSHRGGIQSIAALGWGTEESFTNLLGKPAAGVDKQGAGILPRAVESFSGAQLELLHQARNYKKASAGHGASASLTVASHFTIISFDEPDPYSVVNGKDAKLSGRASFYPCDIATGLAGMPAAFNHVNVGTCERNQAAYIAGYVQPSGRRPNGAMVDWHLSGHSHRSASTS